MTNKWIIWVLMVLSFFSTPLFSEEIKKTAVKSAGLSGRRTLTTGSPFSQPDDSDKKEDLKLDMGGVLMWDYDQFNGVHMGRNFQEGYQVGNETELRRAHIDLKSKFDNRWEAELQINFTEEDSTVEVSDAYIVFTGFGHATLTVGKTKEPFGLEEITGSTYLTFIERSMMTEAFVPGHHPGLRLSGYQRPFGWDIGVFETNDRVNKKDTYALTGRFILIPWEKKNHVLHIGIAGSVRDYGGEPYEIEERAEVHTAAEIISSGQTLADNIQLFGFEFVWIRGPFSLLAEHMKAYIEAVTDDDAVYDGYYLQGSYFLTGEDRSYKKGKLGRIKPSAAYGALELVSRYSFLDVDDNNTGVMVNNLTFGVNYYPDKRARLMINYIRTTLTDGISKEEGKAEAISSRVQYDF